MTPTLRNRVDHVVSEVARVREGVDVGRGERLGPIRAVDDCSGQSSNANYEISHPLVEELVSRITRSMACSGRG